MKKLLITLSLCLPSTLMAVEQICSPQIAASAPAVRYTVHNDGTVTDKATGLTWMRCQIGQQFNQQTSSCQGVPEQMYWQDALQVAQKVRADSQHQLYHFAGRADWRVPDIKELVSLQENSCVLPALNKQIFPDSMAFYDIDGGGYIYLWSATPLAQEQGIMTMEITVGGPLSSLSTTDHPRSVLLVSDKQN